jgi:hypothetical protein
MKLVFFKEENEIKLKLNHENSDEEFNYVRLIEFLHDGNELEDTEYYQDITEEEKEKINDMIQKINGKVVKLIVV